MSTADKTLRYSLIQDWQTVLTLLPTGWEKQIRAKGVLRRAGRKFTTPAQLLRTMLIYLSDKISYCQVSALTKLCDIADVSDVTIMERIHHSGEFFQWMNQNLLPKQCNTMSNMLDGKYHLRAVDATYLKENGQKGKRWRIHFSIDLNTLHCNSYRITDDHTAESFSNFDVSPGDILMGDCAYGTRTSISYVVQKGGDVLTRISPSQIILHDLNAQRIDPLQYAQQLNAEESKEIPVSILFSEPEKAPVYGRLIITRLPPEKAEQKRRKARLDSQKDQHNIQEKTLEAAGYVFLFTTLPSEFSPQRIMALYRCRWQIELFIKRLKSILKIDCLKKFHKDEYAIAWLHGKLFLAILIEKIREMLGDFFSRDHSSTVLPVASV